MSVVPAYTSRRCYQIMTSLCLVLAALAFGGSEAQCPTYFPYGVGTVWQVQSGSELDYSLSQGKLLFINYYYFGGNKTFFYFKNVIKW